MSDEEYLTLEKCKTGHFVYYRDKMQVAHFLVITKISKDNRITCELCEHEPVFFKNDFVQGYVRPILYTSDITGTSSQETVVRLKKMRISPGHYTVDGQIVYLFDPEVPPEYQLLEL